MRTLLYFVALLLVGFGVYAYVDNTSETKKPAAEVKEEAAVKKEVTADNERPAVPTSSATHSVDTQNSVIKWHAKRKIGNEHFGTVSLKQGTLNTNPSEEESLFRGEFVVDMKSIVVTGMTDPMMSTFLNHIKSDDFFSVEQYPEARFVITKFEPTFSKDVTSYTVTGDLTIKDKTAEIRFPATVTHGAEGITVASTFTIDRTTWDIRYGSGKFFKELGDKIIEDAIDFELNLVFKNK